MFPSTYTTSCKWSGMQTITNLVDLGKKMLQIEKFNHQNLSSKFIFPRGFRSTQSRLPRQLRRVHKHGGGATAHIPLSSLHSQELLLCCDKSIQICGAALLWACLHVSFICSSCSALRLEAIWPRNKRLHKQYGSCSRRAIMSVGTSWLHFRDCRRFGR